MSWKRALVNLVLVLFIVVPLVAVSPSVSIAPGKISIPLFPTSALASSMSGPPMVAAGAAHSVGLKSDGTVVAVGDNTYGQLNVGNWTGITQVAAGNYHTVGLRSDGTVVAVGDNTYGQCNVGSWTGITQVATASWHTLGLKSDGTVVAVGDNTYGQRNVSDWTGITQVAAGYDHSVGLKSNGTLVAAGMNDEGQCDVGNWTNIVQVAANYKSTVGLKADGTVVAAGRNDYGQRNVGNWTNIQQVAAGGAFTIGLKSDGTVVAVGDNDVGSCNVGNWTNIRQVAANAGHTLGLRYDGSVLAVGDNSWGQCNVSNWNLAAVPTLTVTPSSGLPGTSMTISGKGFPPYCAISISIGGYPVFGTPISNSKGEFSLTTTVPGLAPGVVAVAATGCGSTATTYLTVLSPNIYVDYNATGNHTGLSWQDAFRFLQDALASAQSGCTIRVAGGAYKPDQGTGVTIGNRSASFQLKNGVAVYGGYAGSALPQNPNLRDVDTYISILSGDLNGDDGPNFANYGENSCHVVTGSGTDSSAILDGFTITGGNANAEGLPSFGDHGGGVFNLDGSPTLRHCSFKANSAKRGGAICNYGNVGSSNPIITDCIFSNNLANYGGAIFNDFASPTLTDCAFGGNRATYVGGAICNYGYSSPTLTNCSFNGNSAQGYSEGGLTYYGGGLINLAYSNPILTNCILWGDTPDEIYSYRGLDAGPSSAVVTYSDVQGGYAGTSNINVDPLFIDAAHGDLHLQNSSPCIEVGDNTSRGSGDVTDLDGNARFVDADNDGIATVDLGAYEFQGTQQPYHTLTMTVSGMGGKGSGSTDPAVGSYSYPAWAVVPITATPACGCSFEGWTGDINTVGNASSASTIITMNSDFTITANFSFHAFCKPGEIIHFPDSNLAEAICEHLGIYPAKQDIAWDALQELTILIARSAGITDLTGLGACTNLQYLLLADNQIEDITPLTNLTNLLQLWIWQNKISAIAPLTNLTNLYDLCLGRNTIIDITPLAGLTNLKYLYLNQNKISYITPLAGLTNLRDLRLSCNQIEDIYPLVDNKGINSGDYVDLTYNLLNIVDQNQKNQNWKDILALQARGVTVDFDPQSAYPHVWVNFAWRGSDHGAAVDGHIFERDAFFRIQDGLNAVLPGGTVHVAAGEYHELITLKNRVTVQGAGASATTINGDLDSDGIGEGSVVYAYNVDSTTKLDGFTITYGNNASGGGMENRDSSCIVTHCIFSHNRAWYWGGGMYNYNSSPKVTDCIFSDNWGPNQGGGMYNGYGSCPEVVNCKFSGNEATEGGGMANWKSSPVVTNCLFTRNVAFGYLTSGGGISNLENSSPMVTNCTFWNNIANYYGSGLYNKNNSSPIVTNCILWGDSTQEIYNYSGADVPPSAPVVSYSDIDMKGQPGVYPGTGNINTNPLFVNPAGGNFQLQTPAACNPRTVCKMPKLSPCIDKGNNTAIIAMFPTTNRILIKDLGGRTRIIDGDCDLAKTKTVDMGAYEALACGATEYKLFCPVDIMVTDPDGLSISKDTNEIPDATYSEPDLDGDGDLDALVYIPEQKAGDYVVTLTPKPDADPGDTFTLEVETAGSMVVLAENVPIGTEPIPTYQYSNQPPVADPSDPDGPYAVDEGSCITLNGTGSVDPEGSPLTYQWDLDNDGNFETSGDTPTFCGVDGPAEIPVTLRVCDPLNSCAKASTTVTVTNVPPTVGAITAPVDPVRVNTPITVTASFTDPGSSDTHTALWAWDDGTPSSEGVVNETNGLGTVSGSHAYTTPGVFTITLTVTDKDSGQGTSVFRYIVVYDPTGAFVTGGGWIDSLPGAYPGNSTLTGKATFGFVSKYQKGATIPMGQTEFQFHVANLNFQSTSYDWLVIAGAKAQYKGTGIINGAGNYGFLLSAIDGQATGGGGKDKFRIKIWDKNNNDAPVYDNQVGEPNDYADPKTTISGGSIVIHK